MIDAGLVAALIHKLETRFLLITYSWCTAFEYEGFERMGVKPSAEQERMLKAIGARESQRLRSEFLFAWLVQIEHLARIAQGGVVHLKAFDDAMVYMSGQTIYDLFADGCVRGPYAMPWDNAAAFIKKVLKPVASLMRSFEGDENLKIPPEARRLLELRGLTIKP